MTNQAPDQASNQPSVDLTDEQKLDYLQALSNDSVAASEEWSKAGEPELAAAYANLALVVSVRISRYTGARIGIILGEGTTS